MKVSASAIRSARKDAVALRDIALRLGLDGAEELPSSPSELRGIYNGAGPERWPEPPRELLTGCLYLFAPAFLIHDCGFSRSDGTTAGWRRENDRCFVNCLTTVRRVFPVFSLRFVRNFAGRRIWRPLALAVGAALMTEPCRRAWLEAGREAKEND